MEPAKRSDWVMSAPMAVLVLLALALDYMPGLHEAARVGATAFADSHGYRAAVLDGMSMAAPTPLKPLPQNPEWSLLEVGGAVALALMLLLRERFPAWLSRSVDAVIRPSFVALNRLHSERVADYTVWLVAGVTGIGAALALG